MTSTDAGSRAVVFDLDGTLVDSLDDIRAALTAALAAAELPPPGVDEVRRWVGDGARALCERAVAESGSDQADAVYAHFRAGYRAAPVRYTRPFDGVIPVLDELAARGLALGVLSNKPHDLTVMVVEQLFGAGRFAAVAGERDGVPLKPHPEAGRRIARELGVEPSRCVLVGDSEIDVAAARAAGMRAIAVAWGLRPRAVLAAAGPDQIVDEPTELLAAI